LTTAFSPNEENGLD